MARTSERARSHINVFIVLTWKYEKYIAALLTKSNETDWLHFLYSAQFVATVLVEDTCCQFSIIFCRQKWTAIALLFRFLTFVGRVRNEIEQLKDNSFDGVSGFFGNIWSPNPSLTEHGIKFLSLDCCGESFSEQKEWSKLSPSTFPTMSDNPERCLTISINKNECFQTKWW